MKRKLLSLLVLLMTASTGAWAGQYLYLDNISGTTATLKCSDSAPESGKPYFMSGWNSNGYSFDTFKSNCTGITIDLTCKSFNGTNISYLFASWAKLETITNTENLRTDDVDDMEHLFDGCSSLTELDLSSWKTDEVVDMKYMFSGCSMLNKLDISTWDTYFVTLNAKNWDGMFDGCTKLQKTVTFHRGDEIYDDYWSTFYATGCNYEPFNGRSVNVFTIKLDGTKITMTEIGEVGKGVVKSGQGVVLRCTASSGDDTEITLVPTIKTADYPGDNSLKGTKNGITTETGEANNYYVLNKGTQGVGFYKLKAGGSIGANKAYLTYTPPTQSAAREYFLFDDEKTGIEMPTADGNDADTVVYDLQGRRVSQPAKGLYIVNGKKIVIK